MKLLTFQARSFGWASHSKTLEQVQTLSVEDSMENCVVVFLHAEKKDEEGRSRAFKHTLKHIKWVASKGALRNVVLHSFTHLGGDTATPEFASEFLDELASRLSSSEFAVKQTPFGYFCSWSIDVLGESMAKVWKDI